MLLSRIFFLTIFLTITFNSKAEIIEKINILGLDNVSRGTVLNYLAIETGDDISKDVLSKSYNSLRATELFSEIKLKFLEGTLSIEVVENPTIKYFDIKGYKEDAVLSEKIIDDIKKNFNLSTGQIYVEKNLNDLLLQLKNLYQSNAYFKSVITENSKIDDKNRIGIEILIDEKERSLIGSFKISGNNYYDNDDLIDLFGMGEADFFIVNYFTEHDHFDNMKFKAGLESLVNKYVSDGFLDVKILKSDVSLNKLSEKLDIDIHISEGNRYKVGNISFTGKKLNFTDKKLKEYLSVMPGDDFKRSKIINGIKLIERRYQNNGYAYVKVDSSVKKVSNNLLDIEISVEPNYLVYLSRIDITGNNRTQDNVIRRNILINEGGLYSIDEIEESIRKIKALGYFSKVEYDLKQRVSDKDKADLFITVEETKTGEFTIGLSHSNATGPSVNLGVSQSNILGTGNTLNATMSNSSAVKELSFYFKNPYFNNYGHSISYGFFDKTLDASNIDASSYTIDESGIVLGYGVPLSNNSDIFAETRFASVDLTCGDDLRTLYEVSDCSNNKDLDIPFSVVFKSSSLNDSFFPTSGSANSVSSSISLPLSDYKYFKFGASHKSYYPVLDKQTFKFSSRFNYGSGYGGENLPFFKRYYEGGASSIRGFDFNSIGAQYANGKPKGSELTLISSVGVATPTDVIGLDNDNIRLIAFIDAGLVAEKAQNFNLNDFRSSAGLQLSWLTPIGPIGLYLAKPIVQKTNDSTESFSFDLGTTF